MGIQHLIDSLEEMIDADEKEKPSLALIFLKADAPQMGRVTVSVVELMLKFFTYASTMQSMSVFAFCEAFVAEYHFRVRDGMIHTIVFVGDDSRFVPSQKKVEQKKRDEARKKSGIEPYGPEWKLESPWQEFTDPTTGLVAVQQTDGALVKGDGKFANRQTKIVPAQLVTTRTLREQLMRALFLHFKYHKWPASLAGARSLKLFWAMGKDDVKLLSSVVIPIAAHPQSAALLNAAAAAGLPPADVLENVEQPRPDLNDRIGEGELKAVWWAVDHFLRRRALAGAGAAEQSPIHVKTRDQDVFLAFFIRLTSAPFVRTAQELEPFGQLLWQYKNRGEMNDGGAEVVDVWQLIKCLQRLGWDVPRFTMACALSGTDYTERKFAMEQVSESAKWRIWTRRLPVIRTFPMPDWSTLPEEKRYDPATLKAHLLNHSTWKAMRATLDDMLRAIGTDVCGFRGRPAGKGKPAVCDPLTPPTSPLLTWKEINARTAAGHYKYMKLKLTRPSDPVFDHCLREVYWYWCYYQSNGHVQSDLIVGRGEPNDHSFDLGSLMPPPPAAAAAAAVSTSAAPRIEASPLMGTISINETSGQRAARSTLDAIADLKRDAILTEAILSVYEDERPDHDVIPVHLEKDVFYAKKIGHTSALHASFKTHCAGDPRLRRFANGRSAYERYLTAMQFLQKTRQFPLHSAASLHAYLVASAAAKKPFSARFALPTYQAFLYNQRHPTDEKKKKLPPPPPPPPRVLVTVDEDEDGDGDGTIPSPREEKAPSLRTLPDGGVAYGGSGAKRLPTTTPPPPAPKRLKPSPLALSSSSSSSSAAAATPWQTKQKKRSLPVEDSNALLDFF